MKQNNAHLTTDVVALHETNGQWQVLLIKRGHAPYQGQWALPGGYVEPNETSQKAAMREVTEETGITLFWGSPLLVGVYDDPGRDPRGRVVSVAYALRFHGNVPRVVAGDDAAEAAWVDLAEINELAFDHGEILRDALDKLSPPT